MRARTEEEDAMMSTYTYDRISEGHDESCGLIVSEGLGFGGCTCNKRRHDAEIERERKAHERTSAALSLARKRLGILGVAMSILVHLPEGATVADAQEIAYEAMRASERAR